MAPAASRYALVAALLLAAACAPDEGPQQQVSDSGSGAFEASLAPTGDGFVVAWYDVRDGNAEIYFRLLTSDGRPADRERRLTDDAALSYEADVQAIGMNIAVAWYDKAADGRMQARLGLWTRDGALLWSRTVSAPERSGRNPVLVAAATRLFVAWIEDSSVDTSEVWAGWWSLAGQQMQSPVRIGPAGRTTWNLNADIDSQGRGWVAYDAKAGTRAEELFLARLGDEGVQRWQVTPDDGLPSKYPDLALSGEQAAFAWYDERDGNQEVYLAVAPRDRLAEGVLSIARRVTNTPGNSIGAYVSWNGDRVGLAWSDDSEGDQHEVFFQRFDRRGDPEGDARRVTSNATSSLIPSIRAARGLFALAWNEYEQPAGDGHGSTGRSEIAFTVVR
jgi:hypothetical protein